MKAIDLFCGAGGMTLGLRNAGWDVIAGVDVQSSLARTYETNNPGTQFVDADLRLINADELRKITGVVKRR